VCNRTIEQHAQLFACVTLIDRSSHHAQIAELDNLKGPSKDWFKVEDLSALAQIAPVHPIVRSKPSGV
jgi:hypothetical protein